MPNHPRPPRRSGRGRPPWAPPEPAPAHQPEAPWEAISLLTRELRETREQRKIEFDWFKSHVELATRSDLEATEKRLAQAIKSLGLSLGDQAAIARQTGLITSSSDVLEQAVKAQELPGSGEPGDQPTTDP